VKMGQFGLKPGYERSLDIVDAINDGGFNIGSDVLSIGISS